MSHISKTKDCRFCGWEVKGLTFMTTRKFRAAFNYNPDIPAHVLVTPKRHVASLFDLTHDEFAEFTEFARNMAKMAVPAFKADGFTWSVHEDKTMGHLHLQIIMESDGIPLLPPKKT